MRAILLLLFLLAPVASASGSLDAGLAVVAIENGHSEDCIEAITDLCMATLRGDGATDTEVDSDQKISRVVVALDRDEIHERLGFQLLPDSSIVFVPSEYGIENPIFWFFINNVGDVSGPGPASAFGIKFNETGHGFSYLGPGLNPISPVPEEHHFWAEYTTDGPEKSMIDRDTIDPQRDYGTTATDNYPGRILPPCELSTNIGCPYDDAPLVEAWRENTPNIIIGLAFVEAGIGTNESTFSHTGDLGERPTIDGGAPLARVSPSDPGPLAGHRDPRPRPLDRRLTPPGVDPGSPLSRIEEPDTVPVRVQSFPPPAGNLGPSGFLGAVAAVAAFLVAALFARIRTKEDALASRRRKELFESLQVDGPATLSALSRKMGVDRKTVVHHARHMERIGLLRTCKRGNFVVLALPHQSPGEPVKPFIPLRQRMVDHLRALGGSVTHDELVRCLDGVPKRSRNHALRELQLCSIVEVVHGAGPPVIRLVRDAPSS